MTGVWICTKPLSWGKINKYISSNSSLQFVKRRRCLGRSHLEIRVNRCSGLTPYSQQGTKDVCPTPQMRELANILQPVSLFDFERKFLTQQKTRHSFIYLNITQQQRVLASPQDYTLRQDGFDLLPVQQAVFHVDFSSARRLFPQHSQTWAIFIAQKRRGSNQLFSACIPNTCIVRKQKRKFLRVVQLRTGHNLKRLQRAPVIDIEKEICLLLADRANPSLQQISLFNILLWYWAVIVSR